MDLNPHLSSLFSSSAAQISQDHPLTALLNPSDERAQTVAACTDSCIKRLFHHDCDWLKSKESIISKESDMANVRATLGEIRAFGQLVSIWPKEIHSQPSKADFALTHRTGKEVWIEVNTPQGAKDADPKLLECSRMKNILIEISYRQPLGSPERDIDNVQGEATSRLSSIKGCKETKQFDGSDIAILWLDLQDTTLWEFDYWPTQLCPIGSFQERLTSGGLWAGWYGYKGFPIFDALSLDGYDSQPYCMEFEGRFSRNTIIDFLVIDTAYDTVIFQNHRKTNQIPDEIFRDFYSLPKFNLEKSWMDWPVRDSLKNRVELMTKEIEEYFRIARTD
jgi:hypothetical protein